MNNAKEYNVKITITAKVINTDPWLALEQIAEDIPYFTETNIETCYTVDGVVMDY